MKVDPNSKHFKLKPWLHQIEGIERALTSIENGEPNYAWLFEVGAGKSKTAVETLRYIYSGHGRLLRTLIVCPPIVIQNWRNEFRISSNTPSSKVVALVGTGAKRLELLRKADSNSIFITNYETLLMKGFFQDAMENPFEIVVGDEIHYVKNPTAKRSKALYQIGDRADYRFGLTGTPILNSTMDIFGIWRFLDKGHTFGDNFFAFRARWFYDKNAGMPKQSYFPNWQPLRSKEGEFSELMERTSQHVKKSDCLDLPPFVKKVVEVPMSKEQEKAYKEMKRDLITFLDSGDKAAIAKLALTKALRLLQITSGFVGVVDSEGVKSTHVFKKTPREEALRDLLQKITPNHKVIIWSIFTENYKTIAKICEEIGVGFVEVNGSVSQKQKDEAVRSFNEDENCRVFSGNPNAAGIGINLVSSSYTIYFSRGFSLGADLQSEARNYRGGSEIHDKVTRIDLVTPGTLDEAVLKKLAMKLEVSTKILDGMRDEI